MTAIYSGYGVVSQSIPYQDNGMQAYFPAVNCGTYSIELTPVQSFLTASKSGVVGADGVTPFYDTLTID
jgi:hypothetical protein